MAIVRIFGYVINLTKSTRSDEDILVEDRIYTTKELAKVRMKEVCQQILERNPKMTIMDYWDVDESFSVKYKCEDCPEHNPKFPCTGECYKPVFNITIDCRQYDFITEGGDTCAVYFGKDKIT